MIADFSNKRAHAICSSALESGIGLKEMDSSELRRSKRIRGQGKQLAELSTICDKENFHRSKVLAPRSRTAKVFAELVVELPTDASDYEVGEDDLSPASVGRVYRELALKIHDEKNLRYNFKVFDDSV